MIVRASLCALCGCIASIAADLIMNTEFGETKTFVTRRGWIETTEFPCGGQVTKLTEDLLLTPQNFEFSRKCQDRHLLLVNNNKFTIYITCDALRMKNVHIFLGNITLQRCWLPVVLERLAVDGEVKINTPTNIVTSRLELKADLYPAICNQVVKVTELLDFSRRRQEIRCTREAIPCFKRRHLFGLNDLTCAGEDPSLVFTVNRRSLPGARAMSEREFMNIVRKNDPIGYYYWDYYKK